LERPLGAYRVVVEPSPDPADLAMLEERVACASIAAAGTDEEHEFGIFLRGTDGEILGGVSGMVFAGCCELQALWVDETLRGRGMARALVAAAEQDAASRGCARVILHSYDVLTHGLYERLGYRTVGVIEDCLGGSALRWYAKELSAEAG
jgi:GNAT superfamily N-acetyltransferase